MAESRYNQFKKYILFEEIFVFSLSLYTILNEKHELKTNNTKFIMTYQDFKKYLRKLRKAAADSCGVVCYKDKMCYGHEVLELMNGYEDFIFDSVENKSLFYKYVEFEKIFDDNAPMLGYVLTAKEEVDLGWKSWSQRMSYLN